MCGVINILFITFNQKCVILIWYNIDFFEILKHIRVVIQEEIMEEISLIEFFSIIKKWFSMIFSVVLIGLIIASIFTFFIATPKYSATTQVLVNQSSKNTDGIQLSDINTNVQMINTYRDIIKGPVILEGVIEELELDVAVPDLSDQIDVATQDNSQVFSLNVISENPYIASDIANTTAMIFQKEVVDIMNIENVKVIAEAVPNTGPISPNNMLNLMFSVLISALLGVGIAFLLEYLDKTVKDEKYIIDKLGWSMLGSVSEMTDDELYSKMTSNRAQPNLRRSKARV